MEIIGLPHVERYRAQIEAYLDENYPGGIKSLLLEMMDIQKLKRLGSGIEFYYPFFSPVADKYGNRGTRIIYGDINRETIFKRDAILHPFRSLRDLFGSQRDDGIRQVFEQELPEVTILGAGHASRLKKAFPKIPFTQFYRVGNSFEERIAYHFVDNAIRNADRRICLE